MYFVSILHDSFASFRHFLGNFFLFLHSVCPMRAQSNRNSLIVARCEEFNVCVCVCVSDVRYDGQNHHFQRVFRVFSRISNRHISLWGMDWMLAICILAGNESTLTVTHTPAHMRQKSEMGNVWNDRIFFHYFQRRTKMKNILPYTNSPLLLLSIITPPPPPPNFFAFHGTNKKWKEKDAKVLQNWKYLESKDEYFVFSIFFVVVVAAAAAVLLVLRKLTIPLSLALSSSHSHSTPYESRGFSFVCIIFHTFFVCVLRFAVFLIWFSHCFPSVVDSFRDVATFSSFDFFFLYSFLVQSRVSVLSIAVLAYLRYVSIERERVFFYVSAVLPFCDKWTMHVQRFFFLISRNAREDGGTILSIKKVLNHGDALDGAVCMHCEAWGHGVFHWEKNSEIWNSHWCPSPINFRVFFLSSVRQRAIAMLSIVQFNVMRYALNAYACACTHCVVHATDDTKPNVLQNFASIWWRQQTDSITKYN